MEASSSVTATARVRRDPALERRGSDAYVAEFLGTLLWVVFVGVVFVVNSAGGLGFTDWAVIGLVHLLVLAMLVHTLGGVSGGHFNPAATVTFLALRRIAPADAGFYVLLQLLGGLSGALIVRLLLPNEGEATNYGAVAISDQFLDGKALSGFFTEAIGTFVLVWALLAVTSAGRAGREWAAFVVGGTLGLVVMCFGPLTGAGVNPARALGPAIVGEAFGGVGDFVVAFILGPLVGGLLAGIAWTAIVRAPRSP